MSQITFEQLPQAISELRFALERVEAKLDQLLHLPEPQDELMSITEAAVFVRLAESTIYSKVCKREIPVIKKGKKLYFERTVLSDWIKSGRKKTVDQILESASNLSLRRGRRNY